MLKRASTRGWASPGAVEEGFSRGCQLELCIARNTTTWAFRRAKILNLGRFTGYSAVKNTLLLPRVTLPIKQHWNRFLTFNLYWSHIFQQIDNFICENTSFFKKQVSFVCAENFQGLPPEAIPAFLQNLQNSASYNIAKPIARPAAYHPYHRPSHQPPQRHLPPNAHHTLQQLFYRGPYLTGKYFSQFALI